MILKGNERGNAKELAVHLQNTADNDHVTVHEIRGFISNDVTGAFKEAYAISKGTKCLNHLFSLSLNPPQSEYVEIEIFEQAIDRIEKELGLLNHPRVIVFHEKHGRRHAHCVWSRIDADTMTAQNIPHYKNKLQAISRELYREHNWKMPQGLIRGLKSNPRNFSLAEWQQCKRMNKNARDLKGMMQDCWAASDNLKSFQTALSERGLILAKGDRRGHVAVTHEGEVISIARYTNIKAKEVRSRLGNPENLPTVDEAKSQIINDMTNTFKRHAKEAKTQRAKDNEMLKQYRKKLVEKQKQERVKLKIAQNTRWNEETLIRAQRLNSGIRGIWQRLTGQYKQISLTNQHEAFDALKRDRKQSEILISKHLNDRRKLQFQTNSIRNQNQEILYGIINDQKYYRMKVGQIDIKVISNEF
ncbi:MAG: relaxase [Alphaproteobacteria bacterium]|nr:relaxase [Alphaproteobacteria bacterium]